MDVVDLGGQFVDLAWIWKILVVILLIWHSSLRFCSFGCGLGRFNWDLGD